MDQVFKVSKDDYGDKTATYNGKILEVENRFDLGSVENFNWGDTGTGSESLSYAILRKVGSREIAGRYAKLYTQNVISRIKKDDWTLNASAVIQWINENTNYSIDENAYFKDGSITYEYAERREEERRKEERRIQREKDFQEEAQRRLKLREEKLQEQRKEERRKEERRLSQEEKFQEAAQKRLQEIQTQFHRELENHKKHIAKQNTEIKAYQKQLEKYKLFIESRNIKSVYDKYCNLED